MGWFWSFWTLNSILYPTFKKNSYAFSCGPLVARRSDRVLEKLVDFETQRPSPSLLGRNWKEYYFRLQIRTVCAGLVQRCPQTRWAGHVMSSVCVLTHWAHLFSFRRSCWTWSIHWNAIQYLWIWSFLSIAQAQRIYFSGILCVCEVNDGCVRNSSRCVHKVWRY